MKNYLYILFFLFFFNVHSQESIEVEFQTTEVLNADKFISVNMFNELFYIKNEVLYKKEKNQSFSYQNVLLGKIYSVDNLNSFEATMFYKDFNTVVLLDRKLGEISKIDFNLTTTFNTIDFATTASNNRFWIFNSDTRELQVYNPNIKEIESVTVPIQDDIIDYYSNYNFCWILTKSKLFQYNVYGNVLNSYKVTDFEKFIYNKNYFILKKENKLYWFSEVGDEPKLISLPELTIKDFSVTNETLYIYDGKELHSFIIKLKKE